MPSRVTLIGTICFIIAFALLFGILSIVPQPFTQYVAIWAILGFTGGSMLVSSLRPTWLTFVCGPIVFFTAVLMHTALSISVIKRFTEKP